MTSIQDMLDGSLDSSLLEYGLSVMPFGKIGGGLLKMMGPGGKKVPAMFQQGSAKLQKLADDPFAAMQDASKHVAKATGVMKGSAKKQAKLLDDGLGSGAKVGISPARMQHVVDRHFPGGSFSSGKSIFKPGANIQGLADDAMSAPYYTAGNGLRVRAYDTGRTVGGDSATGQDTRWVTIVTKPGSAGETLWTAHPGWPRW